MEAVFSSWNSRRASAIEKQMVFLLVSERQSLFKQWFLVMLMSIQVQACFLTAILSLEKENLAGVYGLREGEDVVAGSITPEPMAILAKSNPQVYKSLLSSAEMLEAKNKEVRDIEFTIERGKLFYSKQEMQKAPLAALRFAIDFVKRGA